jgi:hypothetical protein
LALSSPPELRREPEEPTVITTPLRRQLPVDVVAEEEPLQHLPIRRAPPDNAHTPQPGLASGRWSTRPLNVRHTRQTSRLRLSGTFRRVGPHGPTRPRGLEIAARLELIQYAGQLDQGEGPRVAVIGARACSPYGEHVAGRQHKGWSAALPVERRRLRRCLREPPSI